MGYTHKCVVNGDNVVVNGGAVRADNDKIPADMFTVECYVPLYAVFDGYSLIIRNAKTDGWFYSPGLAFLFLLRCQVAACARIDKGLLVHLCFFSHAVYAKAL